MTRNAVETGTANANGQRNAGPINVAGAFGPVVLHRVQCGACQARYRAGGAELAELSCPFCQVSKTKTEVH